VVRKTVLASVEVIVSAPGLKLARMAFHQRPEKKSTRVRLDAMNSAKNFSTVKNLRSDLSCIMQYIQKLDDEPGMNLKYRI